MWTAFCFASLKPPRGVTTILILRLSFPGLCLHCRGEGVTSGRGLAPQPLPRGVLAGELACPLAPYLPASPSFCSVASPLWSSTKCPTFHLIWAPPSTHQGHRCSSRRTPQGHCAWAHESPEKLHFSSGCRDTVDYIGDNVSEFAWFSDDDMLRCDATLSAMLRRSTSPSTLYSTHRLSLHARPVHLCILWHVWDNSEKCRSPLPCHPCNTLDHLPGSTTA